MKRTIALTVLALSLSLFAEDHKIGEPGLTAPRVIYKTEPQYTEEARAAKVSGTVVLSVVVDEQGTAQDIKVTRSLDQGLDQKAVESVQAWRFAPATKDNQPVRVVATIEVNFRLN
jgi:TonB family protein